MAKKTKLKFVVVYYVYIRTPRPFHIISVSHTNSRRLASVFFVCLLRPKVLVASSFVLSSDCCVP